MSKCLVCGEQQCTRSNFSSLFFLKKAEQSMCLSCRQHFVPITETHCSSCFRSNTTETCEDCRYWQNQDQVVQHASLYQYNEAMADYFSRYKFQGDYLLRKVFGKEFRLWVSQWQDYTLVPIPISNQRMEERGFNQVVGLLDAAGLSYQEFLEKEETDKQSTKTRKERLQLQQPFSLKEEKDIPERILLVDDVYTTGTTLMRAKQLLLAAGAKKVKTISLAR